MFAAENINRLSSTPSPCLNSYVQNKFQPEKHEAKDQHSTDVQCLIFLSEQSNFESMPRQHIVQKRSSSNGIFVVLHLGVTSMTRWWWDFMLHIIF